MYSVTDDQRLAQMCAPLSALLSKHTLIEITQA